MDLATYRGSQKLVKCHAINQKGERSLRFVELENFKLWEYMMTHKHRIRVEEPSLCLWVDDEEYARNECLYAHSDEVVKVDRVVIFTFDPNYGYCLMANRFVPQCDSEVLLEIFKAQIPEHLLRSDSTEITVVSGYSVMQCEDEGLPSFM